LRIAAINRYVKQKILYNMQSVQRYIIICNNIYIAFQDSKY